MAQFSSRPPFNDDPKPYVDQWNIDRNEDGDPAGYDFDVEFRYQPRPEFDRPQHNPTNPILVAFRANDADPNPADWVRWLEPPMLELGAWRHEGGHQIEHARKVLTRLVNFCDS